MAPARLEKKQENPMKELIPKDLIAQIAFVGILILAMILFLGFCFAIKGQTYGFL